MSRCSQYYVINKQVLLNELADLSTIFETRITQSDIAREMNIRPKEFYRFVGSPVTPYRVQQIQDFFRKYDIELSTEYLCGETPYKNINVFENCSKNQNRISQLNYLRSLGFNFSLGAVVNVYAIQLGQMSEREFLRLIYLIDDDFEELMLDDEFLNDLSLDNGLMLPLKPNKIDFDYYKKGLEKYTIEFKRVSFSVDYVFICSDISEIYFSETDKPIIFSLNDFDNYTQHIKELIFDDMNKNGYLA